MSSVPNLPGNPYETPKTFGPMPPGRSAAVTVTDVDIPFSRMVVLLLKLMLASVPALLVFYAIAAVVFLIFAVIFGGIGLMVQPQGVGG